MNHENFVVSGPNGSGKSGVVDAIQFALTGEIGRLKGSGTGDLTLADHGPHVEKRSDPDAASVRLDVFIPRLNKSATIVRTIKKANIRKSLRMRTPSAAVEADSALLPLIKRHLFFQTGLDFVDGPHCPLCDKDWDIKALRAHLREKLEKSSLPLPGLISPCFSIALMVLRFADGGRTCSLSFIRRSTGLPPSESVSSWYPS
jgi:hypothetical protein